MAGVPSWVWVGLGLVVVTTIVVVSRPAFRQKDTEVAIRPPGSRLLQDPVPAKDSAAENYPYALMSYAVYSRTFDLKSDDPLCPDVKPILDADHWHQWLDFPKGSVVEPEMKQVHLRVQVWENKTNSKLVIAFGGTDATNLQDWKSNTHWLHPFLRDEYTVTQGSFATAFAEELVRRRQTPGYEYLKGVSLIATGHSLGAGLAQKFAYSLPAKKYGIPQVTKVFAFDTSPVTSALNTSFSIRDDNDQGMEIDRIYERGEVLAILRSIAAIVHRPSKVNPKVTQYRYNVFGNDRYGIDNVISGHSIQRLGCGLKRLAERIPPLDVKL